MGVGFVGGWVGELVSGWVGECAKENEPVHVSNGEWLSEWGNGVGEIASAWRHVAKSLAFISTSLAEKSRRSLHVVFV